MPVSWIKYKNKDILYVDYSKQKPEEMLETLELVKTYYEKLDKKITTLIDVTESHPNNKFMERSKQLGVEIFNPKIEKAAIIGVTGIKKVLLKAYNFVTGDSLKPFDNKEEAKEYLIT